VLKSRIIILAQHFKTRLLEPAMALCQDTASRLGGLLYAVWHEALLVKKKAHACKQEWADGWG
jgi:hypothetical protein